MDIEIFHKNQIHKLFISIVNSLLTILNKKYEIKTCCFEFLEEEINLLNKSNNIDTLANSILNDSFILVPKDIIDTINNYPEDFKIIKGEIHKYKRSLFVYYYFMIYILKFLMLKKLIFLLNLLKLTFKKQKKLI